MKETDFFYWRNAQGIVEKHHVSEFRDLVLKGKTPCDEEGRNPVEVETGKEESKATGEPVHSVEQKHI
jgi:hypothetical protein